MKILHLSTFDTKGGAAVAALRMVEAERSIGLDASLIVAEGSQEEVSVVDLSQQIKHFRAKRQLFQLLERMAGYLITGFQKEQVFKTDLAVLGAADKNVLKRLQEADIIRLHWVQGAFLSLSDLEQICRLNKPIVITLHDVWFATAVSHLPPVPKDATLKKPKERKLHRYFSSFERYLLARKRRIMQGPVAWVAVSPSLANEVKQSVIQARLGIHVIGNPVNPDIFYPEQKRREKKSFDILMVAARLDDPVKGPDYLIKALQEAKRLWPQTAYPPQLHLVGRIKNKSFLEQLPLSYTHYPHYHTPTELAQLYRNCDVTLCCSESETFAQTLCESLATGCPVLSRRCGGPESFIHEGINGQICDADKAEQMGQYLAEMAAGKLCFSEQDCVASVRPYFPTTIAQAYQTLYEKLLRQMPT